MKTLPFRAEDLIGGAGRYCERTRRSSISGVQDKVQLLRKRGGFEVVESGGTHILKPVPRSGYMRLPGDVPANEALTMDIAGRVFRIQVARHELVRLADGELAYLTQRFDQQNMRGVDGVCTVWENLFGTIRKSPATTHLPRTALPCVCREMAS